MSGGSMRSYYMFWYRQGPRGTLDFIYREGDLYGEGFQDRFKGTVESSQNRFTLQIQAAKLGDEAVYYCGASPTLKQLCSRVGQKLTSQHFLLAAANQRLV
uniref:Ig-like domain-containing protein n=1 Tax=Hypotaenidia okinawae TaxID=2861861 RepID=A0A6G1RVB9_9GRUI